MAGKSTLIKTILGLLEPLSGEVIYGNEIKKIEIGYLPQQTSFQRLYRTNEKTTNLIFCIK